MSKVQVAAHPSLRAEVFISRFSGPIGELSSPDWLTSYFSQRGDCPLQFTPASREAVRALLRQSGFKPSGRSKPASEFLEKLLNDQKMGSINLPVDLCNAASLWSGFPISVVDLDLLTAPLRLQAVAADETGPFKEYVFNPSGQVLDLRGLLCLWDSQGPTGSPVKDSQRTKTHSGTRNTLSVVWGCNALTTETKQCCEWYRAICQRAGAQVESVELDFE